MKLSTVAILLGATVSAVPGVVSAESLRANYLKADAFFANPELHDCYSVGNNSCSRLPHCAQERNGDSCLELVYSCSDAGRTICRNGAVQMSSSSRTNQNLGLCEWDSREGCILPPNRDRTTVRVTVSSDAAPRPRSYIRLDVTDSSEDMPSLSEDYDYNEDEEGEDSEDVFSTSEDYADSY